MIWFLLSFFASTFSAIADIVENENFSSSVFSKLNVRFWYKRESWKYAKRIFGYKVDAWHLSKSLMICSFVIASVLYETFISTVVDIILFGVAYNLNFSLWYHVLLRKRK